MSTTYQLTVTTRQEAFDAAYLGVHKQGGGSMRPDADVCAYSGQNGRACGVGQIMAEEDRVDLEKRIAHGLVPMSARGLRAASILTGSDELDPDFLSHLQMAHDGAAGLMVYGRLSDDAFLAGFRERMMSLAMRYDLTIPERPA